MSTQRAVTLDEAGRELRISYTPLHVLVVDNSVTIESQAVVSVPDMVSSVTVRPDLALVGGVVPPRNYLVLFATPLRFGTALCDLHRHAG